jgi:hypothetical protein
MIDQNEDEGVLAVIGSAFDGTHLTREPSEVIGRGRTLRRRRRTMPVLATLGIAGASLSIAMVAGGTTPNSDSAAFSVSTNPRTGAVEVKIYQFNDAAGLQEALADAGVRTVVNVDPVPTEVGRCRWAGVTEKLRMVNPMPGDDTSELFIYPSQDPPGSVYGINYYVVGDGDGRLMHLVSMSLLSGEPTGCFGHFHDPSPTPLAHASSSAR